MTAKFFRCLLAMLMCLAGNAYATPVTFTLSPFAAGGATLSGSLSIDDNDNNGLVVPAEILSWAFAAQGALSFNVASGPGATLLCPVEACFSVVGPDLAFDFSASSGVVFSDALGARVRFAPDKGLDGDAVAGDQIGTISWSKTGLGSTGATFSLTNAPLLVVGSSNPIPEPSTTALLGIALAGGLGLTGRRHRRPASQA